ncbi:Cc2d2a, partial [Symbiodinium sp. KB8]
MEEETQLLSKSAVPLSTYAELRFGGQAAKTTAAVGVNPQWNEDDIVITLFDEEVNEAQSGALSSVLKRERRMLGSVRIPFGAVYRQGNLRGELRLSTPVANLGYQHMRSTGPGSASLEPLPSAEVLERGKEEGLGLVE